MGRAVGGTGVVVGGAGVASGGATTAGGEAGAAGTQAEASVSARRRERSGPGLDSKAIVGVMSLRWLTSSRQDGSPGDILAATQWRRSTCFQQTRCPCVERTRGALLTMWCAHLYSHSSLCPNTFSCYHAHVTSVCRTCSRSETCQEVVSKAHSVSLRESISPSGDMPEHRNSPVVIARRP